MKKLFMIFGLFATLNAAAEITEVRKFLNSDSLDSNHALYIVPTTFKNLPNLGYVTAKMVETNGRQEVQAYFGIILSDCTKGTGTVLKFNSTNNTWSNATEWQDGRSRFGDSMAVALCNIAFRQGLYTVIKK
jgi:hypothetical protein